MDNQSHNTKATHLKVNNNRIYLLRFKKVGTLDWARLFPANASSTSSAGNSRVTRVTVDSGKRYYFFEMEEVKEGTIFSSLSFKDQ